MSLTAVCCEIVFVIFAQLSNAVLFYLLVDFFCSCNGRSRNETKGGGWVLADQRSWRKDLPTDMGCSKQRHSETEQSFYQLQVSHSRAKGRQSLRRKLWDHNYKSKVCSQPKLLSCSVIINCICCTVIRLRVLIIPCHPWGGLVVILYITMPYSP